MTAVSAVIENDAAIEPKLSYALDSVEYFSQLAIYSCPFGFLTLGR